ncbi:hypothetical protein PALA111701_31135 [Paenibacillus lactis]
MGLLEIVLLLTAITNLATAWLNYQASKRNGRRLK